MTINDFTNAGGRIEAHFRMTANCSITLSKNADSQYDPRDIDEPIDLVDMAIDDDSYDSESTLDEDSIVFDIYMNNTLLAQSVDRHRATQIIKNYRD